MGEAVAAPAGTGPITRVRALIAYLTLLLGAAGAAFVGLPMAVLVAAASLPVIALARRRLPLPLALALAFVTLVWGVLVAFVITRFTGLPPAILVLAFVLTGAVFAALLARAPARPAGSLRTDATEFAFISAGGLLWWGVLLVARMLPSGSPMSWVLGGDAANNILFARRLLAEGGVTIGTAEANPVPLTASLIAIFSLPSHARGSLGVAGEIQGLEQMWSLGVVVACLLAGALAAALISRRDAVGLAAIAGASLLPLGWLITSGPLRYGFVNFHLTAAVLLASLVAVAAGRRHPVGALVTICLSICLTLALWSPLAGIPAIAFLLVALMNRRGLLRLRGRSLVLVLTAIATPVATFALLSVPSLLGQGGLITDAVGGVYLLSRWMSVAIGAGAVVAAVLYRQVTGRAEGLAVLLSVLVGGGACLLALLAVATNPDHRWGYYQAKLLWFVVVMIFIAGAVLLLGTAAQTDRRRLQAGLLVAAAVWTVGINSLATSLTQDERGVTVAKGAAQDAMEPLGRILGGVFYTSGAGDRVYRQIVELNEATPRTLLWQSGDPDEWMIQFWTIQLAAKDVDDFELRTFAYTRDPASIEQICRIRELIGTQVTIRTTNTEIADGVRASCPESGEVELIPGS